MVHKDAIKVFSCETCNIDFSSKKYLFVHKNLDYHQQKSDIDQIAKLENFEVKTEIKEEAVEDDLFAQIHLKFRIQSRKSLNVLEMSTSLWSLDRSNVARAQRPPYIATF